jgi:hypothetical protein
MQPAAFDLVAESRKRPCVGGYRMVREVSADHGPEPPALLSDRQMPTPKQLAFYIPQLCSHALPHGVSQQKKSSCSRPPAYMREAEKIEGFWFSVATPLSILGGVPPKLDQSRFVGVKLQREAPQPAA